MKILRSSPSRLKFIGIAGMAVMAFLTACGEHGFMGAPKGSATAAGAGENSATRYFFAAKGLDENAVSLFAAAGAGDLSRVEQAIEAGANVNATDALKRTPLFAAAFCNHPQVADLLIDKGSDIGAKDFNDMSPLHAAVVVGGAETVKALLAKGANIDIPNAASRTPLHLAAATNQTALVGLLLERGSNPQLRDKHGLTAASLAAENGHAVVAATIRKWHEKQKTAAPK